MAISGGRDSVVLLHLLVSAGWRQLVVCHLNHGLRGRESGQDAAWVRRLAKHYDLPCEVEKVAVAGVAKSRRQSLETAGREVRYDFLSRMARKHGASRVFLAHHADDQAETILGNLCRGAGVGGLSGMKAEGPAANGLVLSRPLLQVRRSEIDDYVAAHGLSFREDSSNVRLDHRRNRLRHQVLPLLNQVFAREVAPIIARLGVQAARDDDCLREWAEAFLGQLEQVSPEGSLAVTPELRHLHPALLSRVLGLWLKDRLGLPGIEFEDLEAAASMLHPGGPAKINLPGARHLRRRARALFVTPGDRAATANQQP